LKYKLFISLVASEETKTGFIEERKKKKEHKQNQTTTQKNGCSDELNNGKVSWV